MISCSTCGGFDFGMCYEVSDFNVIFFMSNVHLFSVFFVFLFFFVSQWTISELACYTYSLVAVPLYDTLGTEAIGYIIDKGTQKGAFKH